MPERPHVAPVPSFQLCLDDEQLCRRGPIPLTISSLSGSGLAVLMLKNEPPLLDPSDLMRSGEGRPLRFTARFGGQSIALTAQLVWSELGEGGDDELELIIDAAGATNWPAVFAAYQGAE